MRGRNTSVSTAAVPSKRRFSRSRQTTIMAIAGLVLIAVYLVLSWYALSRLYLGEARFDLEARLDERSSYLTGRFESHINLLDTVERFATTAAAQPGPVDTDAMSSLAETLLAAPGPYGLHVEFADGETFSYPPGVEVPDTMLLAEDSSVSTPATGGQGTQAEPATLSDGSSGIVYVRTTPAGSSQATTTTLLVNLTDALKASELNEGSIDYRFAAVDAHGHVFLGEEGLLEEDTVRSEFFVGGAEWGLIAMPTQGWAGEIHDDVSRTFTWALLVAAFGLGLMFFAISRHQRLEDTVEELERANATKSRFLAQMSHELRTPLNSIIGFSGILLGESPGSLNDEQRRQLKMVERSGLHLLSLVNRLLDLAGIEGGDMQIVHAEYCPRTLILEAVEAVRQRAEAKGLGIRVSVSPDSVCGEDSGLQDRCSAVGDSDKVRTILDELLSYAVEHTEAGGVELAAGCAEDELRFTVTDTGPGTASEAIGRIFDEFSQVPEGEGRLYGEEIGLAFARRAALLLGGDLTVESRPGVGSTFSLHVPRHTAHDRD